MYFEQEFTTQTDEYSAFDFNNEKDTYPDPDSINNFLCECLFNIRSLARKQRSKELNTQEGNYIVFQIATILYLLNSLKVKLVDFEIDNCGVYNSDLNELEFLIGQIDSIISNYSNFI